jgi:ribonuclease-3
MKKNDTTTATSYEQLQQKIGYTFNDVLLLHKALTHKSYVHEAHAAGGQGNERVSFLGDAVIDLIVSHVLMDRFKDCAEGSLTKMRAALVNQKKLAAIVQRFTLGDYILLSRGEEDNAGRKKQSILANVYEALIAAIYYDGGFDAAFSVVEKHFSDMLQYVKGDDFCSDYKSRLQEFVQKHFSTVPGYAVVAEAGHGHEKRFTVQVVINGAAYGQGSGKSKKDAEQEAAGDTLHMLQEGR